MVTSAKPFHRRLRVVIQIFRLGPDDGVIVVDAAAWRVLPDKLRERGATVDVVTVYETRPARFLDVPRERIETADYITFTSSSTVKAFVDLMGGELLTQRLAHARLASIGPVTSTTLREHGLGVAIEATEYTAEGLTAAIVADATGAAGPPEVIVLERPKPTGAGP